MIYYNIRQALYYRPLTEGREAAKKDSVPLTEDEIQQNAIIKVHETTGASGQYKLPAHRREIYKTIGGAPFLDNGYTVFGEVIQGLEILDAIGNSPTDINDKPVKEIRIIKVKIIRN